jgi:CHASE3 domain sensor protein
MEQNQLRKVKLSKLANAIPPDAIATELLRRQAIYTGRQARATARLARTLRHILVTLWAVIGLAALGAVWTYFR